MPAVVSHRSALLDRAARRIAPLVDLVVRLWVANVFLKSGLTKIQSWDSTLALFESEYHVPLLPPALAAWLGTGVELVLPVLLALGFVTRPVALVLSAFNIIAVVSYPDLSARGLLDHELWGLLLMVTLAHGPGAWSVDRWLGRRAAPA